MTKPPVSKTKYALAGTVLMLAFGAINGAVADIFKNGQSSGAVAELTGFLLVGAGFGFLVAASTNRYRRRQQRKLHH